MKFVSNKKPAHYADDLHMVQQEIAKLKLALAVLQDKEVHLVEYLRKFSKSENFAFNGEDGFQKCLVFKDFERSILNQKLAKSRLEKAGLRVPMQTVFVKGAKVDYVYEK